jgi:hypothetical protein
MLQFMLQGSSGSRSKPAEILGSRLQQRDTKKAAAAAYSSPNPLLLLSAREMGGPADARIVHGPRSTGASRF